NVRDMFVDLASFTNSNFFSNHTIYGACKWGGIKPVIRPNNPYPLPELAESGGDWSYDNKTKIYNYNVFGQNVKMCKDLFYFSNSYDLTSMQFVKIDNECAQSQASVLVPTIINSAPALVRRFFPDMEVQVETVIEPITREIHIKVIHTPNNEYKSEILYNGLVEIYINKKLLYSVDAIDGEVDIDNAVLNDGDVVEARIVCGGMIVNSEKSDFEWRIISEKGELIADPNDIDLIIPTTAKFGQDMHIEGKWGQDLGIYPDAMYSIIAGWVKDTTQLWTLGDFEEKFYQPGTSPHHYFRLDVPVPANNGKKYLKLQISMRASMADARYWLQGRVYKIPVK
ncbi:hypothetical protein ACFLSQ_04575, partial [Bacteroidota bacterium]